MNRTFLTLIALLTIISTLHIPNTFAQEEPRTLIQTRRLRTIAFSPDSKTLASLDTSGNVQLWDASTGKQSLSKLGRESHSIAFSPDGNTLAIGERNGNLSLWDVATRIEKKRLRVSEYIEAINKVLFSPDGATLATISRTRYNSNTSIHLLDTESGNVKTSITVITTSYWQNPISAQSLSFSPDSSLFAHANQQSRIDLWDVNTSEIKKTLAGHTEVVHSTAFSPDGQTLVSGSKDGTVRLLDVTTGESKITIEPLADTNTITRVMFSPDGNTLLINTEETARLWDVNTSTYKANIKGISGSFSPDSSTLATVENDTVYLWDVETARPKAALRADGYNNNNVLFSPDGNTLAVYGGYIHLWNLQNTNRVRITPYKSVSPANGQTFTINVAIENGQNVGGYQFSVIYDANVLRYVGSANQDYLPDGAFPIPPIEDQNKITLAATSVDGTANGEGNLANITFEVLDIKATTLVLTDVILTDSNGNILPHLLFNTGIVIDPQLRPEDVNSDGIVNITDLVQVASRFHHITDIDKEDINKDGVVNIVDLVKVAAALGAGENAPALHSQKHMRIAAKNVQHWIILAKQINGQDDTFQLGLRTLERLAKALAPKETALFPNYPNPFNPETWIPYQLAKSADVTLTIYSSDGKVVRKLQLGSMPAGRYQIRSRAAHWDGKNAVGEPVASGLYFYTLTADDFTATRKLLIRK